MKKLLKGTVENIEKVADNTFKIEIKSPLDVAFAGQFISILCENKTFRRPFSIAGFKEGVLTVLFKLKGEGTNYIKSLKKGSKVDFMGALGNGFKIENKKSLLVGAGIGIAPMLYLKEELNKKGIENFLIAGFKCEKEVIKGADKVVLGGSVLDNLENLIDEFKPEVIYSCGPNIVLKLLSKIGEKKGIETQVALEKVMACQIGVCRGCVIQIKDKNGAKNATICKDGPVFSGSEVIW